MAESNQQPSGSNFTHKVAAVSLAIVSMVIAFVLFQIGRPDEATLSACIARGGSGSTCPTGGILTRLSFLIVIGGFAGAAKVWRGQR
jgi:hypothetical protein